MSRQVSKSFMIDDTGAIIATLEHSDSNSGASMISLVDTNGNPFVLVPMQNAYTDGLRPLMCASFTFDPSANAGQRTIGDHGLGVTLPAGTILTGIGYTSMLVCGTDFHSATDAGTIALSLETAGDILPPTATQSLTVGNQSGDMSSTFFKTTVAREITATVAVEDLTAGKLHGFITYVVSG